MRILCDQLEHTQKNLELLQQEIERLLDSDPKARSLLALSELGPMTVAVLRVVLQEVGSNYFEHERSSQSFLSDHSEQMSDEYNLATHLSFCYALHLSFA